MWCLQRFGFDFDVLYVPATSVKYQVQVPVSVARMRGNTDLDKSIEFILGERQSRCFECRQLNILTEKSLVRPKVDQVDRPRRAFAIRSEPGGGRKRTGESCRLLRRDLPASRRRRQAMSINPTVTAPEAGACVRPPRSPDGLVV
jgi:hypothetical protein